ncbi:BRO-N domain-containing protein [Citrobacter koseri]|nr:Bro-N domain-containing protein [Citrobacter koseri]
MNSLAKSTTDYTIFKFDDKDVRVVVKNGEPWFVAVDLCDALNLTNSRVSLMALDDDEKSVSSTYTIKGNQEVAVVSESGMYTLILRCRDAVKPGTVPYRVRKWVTSEVLPSIRKTGSYEKLRNPKKTMPGKITAEQQEAIKQLVMTRGKALPKESQAKAMITMWSSLKSHFGCSYKEISDDQFTEALSIAARVPLEGEFLGKQEELPAPKLDISFPMSWFAENAPYAIIRQQSGDTVSLDRNVLVDCSPAYRLLDTLTKAGYDVEAARTEIKALRTIMAEQSWALKEIASYTGLRDKACHSVRL